MVDEPVETGFVLRKGTGLVVGFAEGEATASVGAGTVTIGTD
jgi:hypothetical protein